MDDDATIAVFVLLVFCAFVFVLAQSVSTPLELNKHSSQIERLQKQVKQLERQVEKAEACGNTPE